MNKIILEISPVSKRPACPWVRQFIVSVRNSVDNTDNFVNNNSEEIENYQDIESLEQILNNIIMHLRHGYHISGIDQLEEEELKNG